MPHEEKFYNDVTHVGLVVLANISTGIGLVLDGNKPLKSIADLS